MTREKQLVSSRKGTRRRKRVKQGLNSGRTDAKTDYKDVCHDIDFVFTPDVKSANRITKENRDSRWKISRDRFEKLRLEQNFSGGIIAGVAMGIIGAVLWGATTVITNLQVGFMAIVIGAGVGFSIRYFGKGLGIIYGILGAVIAVLSCVLGNFFSIVGFIANNEGLEYLQVLKMIDVPMVFPMMVETVSFMDLLFYGIAGYEGFKFSFRVITEKELAKI
jgi:hypothetical protein